MKALFQQLTHHAPRQSQYVYRFDGWLMLLLLALVSIGLIMMSSSAVEFAAAKLDQPLFHLKRQLMYIVIALFAGTIVYHIPSHAWRKQSWLLLFFGFLLLLLVVIPGIGLQVNGSRRWLPLGVMNLQSSEIAKFCILVYLADYLVRRHDEVRNYFKGFFKPIIVIAVAIVLLLLEPDFGAVVVLLFAALGMMFLGGVKLSQFLILIATAGAAVGVMAASSGYRLARLMCFLDPWEQPFDCGYQLTQSLMAFGRGEWFGVGLGESTQKLFYLPEAHTDFVFAILAEELGVIGAFAVIALFSLFIFRIVVIARQSEIENKFFNAYMCYGIGLMFAAQLFINVGVNMGVLPTKGLTLPFLSFGGSSLLISFVFVAFVQRAYAELDELIYSTKDVLTHKPKLTNVARHAPTTKRKRKKVNAYA